MKFKQNWKTLHKHWDKILIRLRISSFDFFSFEVDIKREFYMLTILNFTIKNR